MDLLSTLNKNIILTGPVDSYCLVCNQLIRGEEECLKHIDIPVHQKNVSTVTILDNFKEDNIVKLKQGFYCIYCNAFLKIVESHIIRSDHKQLKILRSFRRLQDIILAFQEVQIQEYAFHGFTENSCTICRSTIEAAESRDTHIQNIDHLHELIKNKCIFGDNFIYRLIDKDTFFCLICVKVYNNEDKSDHHNTTGHKNNYDKGKQLAIEAISKIEREKLNEAVIYEAKAFKNEPVEKNYETPTNKLEKALNVTEIIKDTSESEIKVAKSVAVHIKNNDNPLESLIGHELQKMSEENLENRTEGEKDVIEQNNEIVRKSSVSEPHKETAPKLPIKETKMAAGIKKVPIQPDPKAEGKKKKEKEKQENKARIEKENVLFKQNEIYIEFKTETVYCEHCDEDLEFNYKLLKDHLRKFHLTSFTEQDLDPEIIQYAYENYMRISDRKAYCKLCEEDVNTNLDDMKDHVNFYIHIDIVMGRTGFGPLTKTTAKEFFDTLVGIENSLTSEVMINNNYVLTLKSFHTVVDVNRTMSCALCKTELKNKVGDVFMQHIAMAEHKKLLVSCNVVTSLPNELVRELRPGVYHCGYCNVTYSSWFYLVSHVTTKSHDSAKRHALWSLERSRITARSLRPTQIASLEHVTIS